MSHIDYKSFIEDNYYIKSKFGELVPFLLNDVQGTYYRTLLDDYPDLVGIREIDLKGRQFGMSSFIAAMFATDFIFSSLGEIPLTDGDIYSHKDKETAAHFARVNMFLDSYLLHDQGGSYLDPNHRKELPRLRKAFLKVDNESGLLIAKNTTQIQTATAGAKTSGRGSTKLNLLWSEPAFYPNTSILSAENLMTGAEEQVPTGFGKIFRESTGNLMADYFALEYRRAKDGLSDFKARFHAWFSHKAYTMQPEAGWTPPAYYDRLIATGLATVGQCYWHFKKTRGLTDKKRLREYPTYDYEAFLYGGQPFFDADALLYYTNHVLVPTKEVMYVSAL
ncbi:MAG TPA: hypothetical protein VLH38_00460 [Patescibacteria group bacterium]|nr:hypothetical protein [Patescibacteria group bacterium]